MFDVDFAEVVAQDGVALGVLVLVVVVLARRFDHHEATVVLSHYLICWQDIGRNAVVRFSNLHLFAGAGQVGREVVGRDVSTHFSRFEATELACSGCSLHRHGSCDRYSILGVRELRVAWALITVLDHYLILIEEVLLAISLFTYFEDVIESYIGL